MSEGTDKTQQEILEMLETWTRSLVPEQARFINDLADLEPEIRPIIAEHIEDNHEMLPTILMADIARWVTDVAHNSADPAGRLKPLLDTMENAWGDGQNTVADLIATGFVENIFDEPDVVRLLGPHLTRSYRIYTGQDTIREDEKRPMPEVMKAILKKLGRM
ncbi:hypothetical protein NDR87_13875 [Nocardia sp. CDC159]|uniref:DUF7674 domain-containing protein n=1 Tax=Nocardia pulmonis TaxID=2951408 RepID=A0A9X2IXC2_9NOCA|nr:MULTISPECIES: hypothetical protein [Nocardia]MCM6774489.1 hypothetical protein [Nocardia pulmonis]MCM6787445.1 hypothetical protein [Nocardia sp. CDC159]